MEDRLPVLDRDHAPGGEGPAVADAVDGVDDRRAGVAGPQEVRVQGVRVPVLGDRAAGGDQRLRGDLPAEDPGDDGGPGVAAEDVPLDPLEVEQIEQRLKCLTHMSVLSCVFFVPGAGPEPVTAPCSWR